MKGKKEKVIVIEDKEKVGNLDGKKCYMRNTYLSLYLESNNVGDVYFSQVSVNKWEFAKTDLECTYTIKHIPSQLYLTSNEKGDLFTTVQLNSTFQKWTVHKTSTPDVYGYENASNGLYLGVNIRGEIYLSEKDEKSSTGCMYTFQFFPKK